VNLSLGLLRRGFSPIAVTITLRLVDGIPNARPFEHVGLNLLDQAAFTQAA
jgi:hypothetical protein